MMDEKRIAALRALRGSGLISAVGEYTPMELWEALDTIESLRNALRRVLDTQDAADEARALVARNPGAVRLERAAVAKAIKFLEARADAKALLDEGDDDARLGGDE